MTLPCVSLVILVPLLMKGELNGYNGQHQELGSSGEPQHCLHQLLPLKTFFLILQVTTLHSFQ